MGTKLDMNFVWSTYIIPYELHVNFLWISSEQFHRVIVFETQMNDPYIGHTFGYFWAEYWHGVTKNRVSFYDVFEVMQLNNPNSFT